MSPPRKSVTLSPDAQGDFTDIVLYTWQQWGEKQRDRYEANLRRAIADLAKYPEVGVSWPGSFRVAESVLSSITFFTIGSGPTRSKWFVFCMSGPILPAICSLLPERSNTVSPRQRQRGRVGREHVQEPIPWRDAGAGAALGHGQRAHRVGQRGAIAQ